MIKTWEQDLRTGNCGRKCSKQETSGLEAESEFLQKNEVVIFDVVYNFGEESFMKIQMNF